MRSVRHVAEGKLREALHESGIRPPWPSLLKRLYVSAAERTLGVLGQAATLVAWLGGFTVLSYLPYLPHGRLHLNISAATTSLLSVLWQVQATSVGLILALVVFVFGLLPEGRGRLTYREFLRRTWALRLTTFNVASLLFIGLVLLGVGRQVSGVGSTPGYGWAVAMASILALISIATIVVILARTLQAINPETQAAAQLDFRRAVVVLAARDELLERESVQEMGADTWRYEFSPAHPGPGRVISAREPGDVRDVSVWRLSLLKRVASWRHHHEPVVRAWPWMSVSIGTPLITVDLSSGRLERWWASRCVRTRGARPDLLGTALAALHGESLEHIRAGRQAEAVSGMRDLASLLELLWEAYTARGRAYGEDTGGPLVLTRRGVRQRIEALLNDLFHAAAVSADDTIRQEASDLPRVIARKAIYREVPGAVQQMVFQLEGVYVAAVGELSMGGLRDLPVTGLARGRLHAPFRSLLTFTNYYLAQAVDQAAAGGKTGWDGRSLPATEFLIDQLRASNEGMLQMLRRAVQFRDGATVRRVLDRWKMPYLFLARNAVEQAAAMTTRADGTGKAGYAQDLAKVLSGIQADLDAMMLRLLVVALDAEDAAYGKPTPPVAQPPAVVHAGGGGSGPEVVTEAVIDHLPHDRLWDVLERAIQTGSGDWRWQYSDDEIMPVGVVDVRPVDTVSPLIEAFSLAVVSRPGLIAGASPGRQFVLDYGSALITAITRIPAEQKPWLERHHSTVEIATSNAATLETQLKEAEQTARRELEEDIRRSALRPEALVQLRRAAQAAFREQDITAGLFTWAGRLVPGTGMQQLSGHLTLPRRHFTDINYDGAGIVESDGQKLSWELARKAREQLPRAASGVGETVTVPWEGVGEAIRDSITHLSVGQSGEMEGHALGSRIVVFIPDLPVDVWDDLGITGSQQPGGPGEARRAAAERLGFGNGGLAWHVAGAIEEVPVFATAPSGEVLVIDLARFGDLRRVAEAGENPLYPVLTSSEPADPLRPSVGDLAAGHDQTDENQLDPLQLRFALSLPTEIMVKDASAARIIKIA